MLLVRTSALAEQFTRQSDEMPWSWRPFKNTLSRVLHDLGSIGNTNGIAFVTSIDRSEITEARAFPRRERIASSSAPLTDSQVFSDPLGSSGAPLNSWQRAEPFRWLRIGPSGTSRDVLLDAVDNTLSFGKSVEVAQKMGGEA